MLFNLRGPNGSGKTTVGRELMRLGAPHKEVWDGRWRPLSKVLSAYELSSGITVLGRYNPGVVSGGLEGSFRPFSKVVDFMIEKGNEYQFVFGESMMLSSSVASAVRMATELDDDGKLVVGVLDTPLDVCLERIYARNGGKEIKIEALESLYRRVARMPEMLRAQGIETRVIDHRNPAENVLEIFKEYGL